MRRLPLVIGSAVASAVLAAGPVAASAAAAPAARRPAAGSWAQFRYGPARNADDTTESRLTAGTVAGLRASSSLAVSDPSWVLQSTPTLAGGAVYLATWDGHLVCADAATGAVRWSRTTTRPGFFGAAPVDGRRIYTWLADGTIRAYATADGRQLWSVPESNGGGSPSSSLAWSDGVLYGESWTGDVFARSAATGGQRWRVDLGAAAYGSPTLWRDELVVVDDASDVVALDAATGAVRWRTRLPQLNWDVAPAVGAGGQVFVVDQQRGIEALDARTGTVRWHTPVRAAGDDTGNAGDLAVGPGTVYFTTLADQVTALDAADGSPAWQRHLAGSAFSGGYESQPVLAGGLLWVTAGRGLVALDAGTGRQLRRLGTAGVFGEPVVTGGRIYTAEADGSLHVYSLAGTTANAARIPGVARRAAAAADPTRAPTAAERMELSRPGAPAPAR